MTLDTTKLAAPLQAGRVKTREGGNGRSLSYIETHDAIRTANDIFGFGEWGHEIVELRPLEGVAVTTSAGKTGHQVGYICIVRLTVSGCVPTSGIGYGDAVEYRGSAPVTAHELAAKEAESDALKRALKNFGDQFGLALYDKAAAQNGHVTNGPGPAGDPPRTDDPPRAANGATISDPQRKRLFAIAKSKNLTDPVIKQLVKDHAGVDSSSDIPKTKYDAVIAAIEAEGIEF